jgi:hypothetical protein
MRDMVATYVSQLDTFELRPQPFVRVQLGGIGWETFQVNPLRGAIRQELFDDVATVNGRAIPNDHHATGHLAQQVFEKGDNASRIEGTVLAAEVDPALGGDSRNGRQMIPRPPLAEHGRLSPWGIGAHDTGQGVKPGFVYEEDGLLLGFRPLLMAGQVSARQRVIAASSRWRARRIGFWGLQRIALHRRPTWVRW